MNYDQGYIQVAPVNPQVVYLPAYDPWTVYGQPIQPYRGFSLIGALGSFFGSSSGSAFGSSFGSSFGSGAVRFGLGIAMSAFSHTSFGWLGWGLDWLTHSLLFHNSNYYSHSTTVADWGLPRGGPRAAMQRGAMTARLPSNDYRPENRIQDRGQFRSQSQNNFSRPGLDSHAYGGYNRPPAQGFAHPSDASEGYANNRPYQGAIRNYSSPGAGYARPPMEAYNRVPPQASRPQQYARPTSGYGSGFYNSPAGGYAARPNPAYGSSQQAYRAASPGFQRGDFGERSSNTFVGRGLEGYSGKAEKSGGSHFFGGGHEHAPKAPKPYKESSHGHAEKGGHSGGLFGGKHHR